MSDQGANQGNQEAEEPQEIFFGNLPLEFVVSVILGQGTEADTPLCKAFRNEGIDEYPDLLSMSQEDIENLCYHEEENGETSSAVIQSSCHLDAWAFQHLEQVADHCLFP